MNLDQFREENTIIDPNVRRKSTGSQGTSVIVDPNIKKQKRVVTPKEMGFTHEEPAKINRPEDPILDRMDIAIKRKQDEARIMANAIDESDGEGITEEEFQDLLVQNSDLLDDGIPTEEELLDRVLPSTAEITNSLPTENPAYDLFDELDAEDDEPEYDIEYESDEYDWDEEEPETIPTPIKPAVVPVEEQVSETKEETDHIFTDFESGEINFDEEDEELEENIDEDKKIEKEQKEQMEKLRSLVREKISPVSKALDISSFSIVKRPAANTISTPREHHEKIADWVLMSSQKPIYMKRFSGTEIERLANGGKGRTRLNRTLDTWQLIYNHIVDPHKPESLEAWARSTSFLDIDHIYMAIYRANFEGSNYIPYNCTNDACKEVFLSDSFDIMEMCKFKSKEDKERFNSILGSETSPVSKLYSTEVVPVSDEYAFVFREPSIYNISFESAVRDEEFVEKFGDLISICAYIDGIYKIDMEHRELQPVQPNVYKNNMKKTAKSRIVKYSKIISTLGSDEYNTLLAYMQKINESGESLSYQIPEVTCPKCKTVVSSVPQEARNLVFTRHQLAALATL